MGHAHPTFAFPRFLDTILLNLLVEKANARAFAAPRWSEMCQSRTQGRDQEFVVKRCLSSACSYCCVTCRRVHLHRRSMNPITLAKPNTIGIRRGVRMTSSLNRPMLIPFSFGRLAGLPNLPRYRLPHGSGACWLGSYSRWPGGTWFTKSHP